jgi:tetratricopeptide (TPR) repeat protein
MAFSNSALIALRAGRLTEALARFEGAEAYLRDANPNDRYSILLNIGALRMDRGELRTGRRALIAAIATARETGVNEFKALHNVGYLDFLLGDIPGALRQMDDAVRAGPDTPMGIGLLDRARVLAEAGLVHAADENLSQAADLFRANRLSQDLAETELERARCALISGEVQAARRFASAARDRFRRRGNDRWRRTAELVLLQADLAAGRPGARLVSPAVRLQDELQRDGRPGQARTAALIAIEARLRSKDVDRASADLQQLGKGARTDPITLRLHEHHVLARVEAARGRTRVAARRVARGLADLAEYQSRFGSMDLSTAAAVHGRRLAELDLSLALGTGSIRNIFAAAERGRAATSRLAPVRPPEDSETAALLAELRRTVEALRGAEVDTARTVVLMRRRKELQAKVSQRAWTRRGPSEVASTANLAETRRTLTDRTMATFVVSAETVGAVVLDDSLARYLTLAPRAQVVELVRRIRADLDVLAQPQLPASVSSAVGASFARSVGLLDDLLIRPLQTERRLVLSTTGLLGQIPWNALPSLRGVPIEVTPSATAWLTAREVGKRARGRRLVSIAGPGLVRSSDEAGAVARAWGLTTSVSGTAATGAALSKAMSSARVVHVAAHGTHQNENPLFSSIRLADGPLFAHELDQTAGTPEHVVLSACELGLATIRPGDEALGLTSVLLRLGTRSVVAGVARIGDDHAAESMAAYHRLLARGVDSASALAQASEAVDHPLPLVCFGAAWSVT